MKTFSTTLERFESDLWHYHIKVPEAACEPFMDMDAKRVVCTLNGTEKFHCALMPDGLGGFFININKEIRTKLHVELGDEVRFSLERDESKYGLPMPQELEELLKLDDEGNRHFHALTPGKQRSLIFIIGKPKNSDTRLRKALGVVDYLKSTGGKLDFKALHESLKLKK